MSDEPREDVGKMIDALEAPFPAHAIQQRQGAGNRKLDYLETQTVIRRLNEATDNCWDWRIDRFELQGDTWIALGHLTIPGLGTRPGVGVQKVTERSGEDLVKGAESDALKRAATRFGVGLDLYGPDYEAGEVAAPRTQQRQPAQPKLMTQLESRRIHEHAKKHNLWQEAMDYGHATYRVDDINQLTVDQGRELYRWITEQARLRELNPSDEELAGVSGGTA